MAARMQRSDQSWCNMGLETHQEVSGILPWLGDVVNKCLINNGDLIEYRAFNLQHPTII